MKSSNKEHVFRKLGVAFILAMLVLPAMAQETVKEKVNIIEVKDGKVFVNGEMIKELDDKNARVQFSRNGENNYVFFSDDDENGLRNYRLRSPGFIELKDQMGNVEFFGDEHENAFAMYNTQRSLEPLHELSMLREGSFEPFMAAFGQSSETRKLEMKSEEIARQLRRADGEDMDALNSELEELLNKIFDMKLTEQRDRMEKLAGEMDELRDRVQERSNSRSQIIERRLRQLKGDRDTLDW